ncbi:MAG TPA: GNAT family N-acetyltransferase [Terriglobia bacterium]|nr:GNAT family N-acetyltransferase [Terriglobia bacterium]
MNGKRPSVAVRNTRPEDFGAVIEIGRETYPASPPWTPVQLASHLRVFPEGQFVAVETDSERVVGMAASLIVHWEDYDPMEQWRDFTDFGMFTNHDPERGSTLYGAEVMVSPSEQRRGVGSKLYAARRRLVEELGLRRIRAGGRLRGYGRYANRMSAEEYVMKVVNGELRDPTLSFQLKHGFHVLAVVAGYLTHDPESLGYAAVIEWINEQVAKPEDYAARNLRFLSKAGIAGGPGWYRVNNK